MTNKIADKDSYKWNPDLRLGETKGGTEVTKIQPGNGLEFFEAECVGCPIASGWFFQFKRGRPVGPFEYLTQALRFARDSESADLIDRD